jgi:predicted metal-dependent phosphoesterase TrpH
MAEYVDLHLHTTFSDGKKSPAELLDYVRRADLEAWSITDHDSLEGYFDARSLLLPNDPELITGIELSALVGDRDLHILAYFIDPEYPPFLEALENFREQRSRRSLEIVEKLQSMGLAVSFDAVREAAGEGVIGRPHIAEAMVEEGAVGTYEEAFRKYIRNGGPAYIPKARMTPREAIELTHNAGGLATLAHPFLDNMYELLPDLVDAGLDAIEAYHYTHSTVDTRRAGDLARQYNLAITGGSDYHGRENRTSGVGSEKVPKRIIDSLRERLSGRNV